MQCTRPMYALINKLSDGSNSVKILPKRVDCYSREVLEAKQRPQGKFIICPCPYLASKTSRE